jgi:hypothetical protein
LNLFLLAFARSRSSGPESCWRLATPMRMMDPVRAGTLSVVPVINRNQGNPRERRGQRGDHDKGIQARLEVHYDRQIHQDDRAGQTSQRDRCGRTPRFGLPVPSEQPWTRSYRLRPRFHMRAGVRRSLRPSMCRRFESDRAAGDSRPGAASFQSDSKHRLAALRLRPV